MFTQHPDALRRTKGPRQMTHLAVTLGLADLPTAAERIARVEAYLASPDAVRYAHGYAEEVAALRLALRLAKRKNMFGLPARMPAFKPAAAWTSVPTMATLARYCGSTSEAFRIREAIKARGIPAKVAEFVPAQPVALVA